MVESLLDKFGTVAALTASLACASACLAGHSQVAMDHNDKTENRIIRLASFAPSCTELIESINAQNCLVGVCKFCDLSNKSPIERIGDFNSANLERLTRLKPDMVLAVSGQDPLIGSLKKNGFNVTVFQNSQLSDIGQNLLKVGKLTHHEQAAEMEAQAFESSLKELKRICSATRAKPKVFFCVWPQPLLTAGNTSFLHDALQACGGKNIAGDLSAPYPHFSMERLVLANPDIVIMPFEAKANDYLKRSPWTELQAAKQHQIYFLPKFESDRLSRPSTQVIDGLYWLGKSLHPEKSEELSTWLQKSKAHMQEAATGGRS